MFIISATNEIGAKQTHGCLRLINLLFCFKSHTSDMDAYVYMFRPSVQDKTERLCQIVNLLMILLNLPQRDSENHALSIS